ncbi:hypothetical protein GGX14DRAFT_466324 [Mycena pura]|uniref:Secreted protein n=1 Tax=Mycena pura TaxID=153505 RepID=A0AAD6V4X4_9AGAR|nr:hypothetical protein GGX14DRAFT_466324 [Mycena pura]
MPFQHDCSTLLFFLVFELRTDVATMWSCWSLRGISSSSSLSFHTGDPNGYELVRRRRRTGGRDKVILLGAYGKPVGFGSWILVRRRMRMAELQVNMADISEAS